MNRPQSRVKIWPFIRAYNLDPTEFSKNPDAFLTFNEFFTRSLRPESRPIDPNQNAAIFPADGRHLGYQSFGSASRMFVKGAVFSIADLLQSDKLARQFVGGPLIVSRLCPTDYHRFHFSTGGTPGAARTIPGPLLSVNPIALRRNIHILARNHRMVTELNTPDFGTVLLIEVGATCVGSIHQSYTPESSVSKGDEKGWFSFGGSTIITIFEPGSVQLAHDLLEQTEQGMELYARMGSCMALR